MHANCATTCKFVCVCVSLIRIIGFLSRMCVAYAYVRCNRTMTIAAVIYILPIISICLCVCVVAVWANRCANQWAELSIFLDPIESLQRQNERAQKLTMPLCDQTNRQLCDYASCVSERKFNFIFILIGGGRFLWRITLRINCCCCRCSRCQVANWKAKVA